MWISDVLDDLPGLEAAGADLDGPDGSLGFCPYFEKVGKPGPARSILRVRNIITEYGAFSADFAFSGHALTPDDVVCGHYQKGRAV